jgi:hypothetical protein
MNHTFKDLHEMLDRLEACKGFDHQEEKDAVDFVLSAAVNDLPEEKPKPASKKRKAGMR